MAIGKKTGGRQKGTPNKINIAVTKKLQELDCCPITALVSIAKEAHEAKDLALAANVYKDLAQYVSAKLKPSEVIEHASPQQLSVIITRAEDDFE